LHFKKACDIITTLFVRDGWNHPNVKNEVKIMKDGIHPEYYQAKVICNCGNEFVTGSTKKEIHVEVCSKCHPFYTGQQKTAAARGRIDKFNKKYGINAQ
jgi:large subunit ribosomal protein L31